MLTTPHTIPASFTMDTAVDLKQTLGSVPLVYPRKGGLNMRTVNDKSYDQ